MGSVEDVIECICCGDSCRVSPFATVFANVFRFELILKFIYIYPSCLMAGLRNKTRSFALTARTEESSTLKIILYFIVFMNMNDIFNIDKLH